jgi:uncharacterized membrane protein YedE/YeeE
MMAALATLVIGGVVGYLAQRSRLCFVGGLRDFILVRDTYLLKGLAAFALAAWVAFPAATLATGVTQELGELSNIVLAALTVVGGFGVGYFSILANGCPLRQHVLAAQGVTSSIAYLVGFLAGAVVFHAWVAPTLLAVLP